MVTISTWLLGTMVLDILSVTDVSKKSPVIPGYGVEDGGPGRFVDGQARRARGDYYLCAFR